MITTTDPRTGVSTETSLEPTSPAEVTRLAEQAAASATALAAMSRSSRADLLDAIAQGLESDRETLVATAMAETGLPDARLQGELTRTVFQFRLFAEAVRDGGFLEAIIDHAGDTPLGPGPDVRRMLIPIGPVAVFGSSNFPFAFSVPGGDTASALAAGNPVVLKAHSAHPLTCARAFGAMNEACVSFGAPSGILGIVYGQAAGAQLVAEPAIRAVGFTGSLSTGKRLQEIIDGRPEPIPFYGELSSLNPLVLTEAALNARSEAIATGLATSVIASGGQLCTKPGFAFVPVGPTGDAFIEQLAEVFRAADPSVLLNARVHESFESARTSLEGEKGVTIVARGGESKSDGYFVTPTVLNVTARDLTPAHTEEAFGPLIVAVRYDSTEALFGALTNVPPSLTASLHCEDSDSAFAQDFVDFAHHRAGRLVFNGYPTGVRVCWAQHHGGPWPSTNTIHTSVGVTAMRRFLRPLAWQDAPAAVLPEELRDDYAGVDRRVDGVLVPGKH